MKTALLVLSAVLVFGESRAGKWSPTAKSVEPKPKAKVTQLAHRQAKELAHAKKSIDHEVSQPIKHHHHKQDVEQTTKAAELNGRIEFVVSTYGSVETIVEATGTTLKRILAVYKQQMGSGRNYWIVYEGLKDDICILNVYITLDDTVDTHNTRCNHLIVGPDVEKH